MKSSRRRWVWIGLLICYVLVMTFGGCADRLILFPTTGPIHTPGIQRHVVSSGGKDVEIWIARAGPVPPELFILEFTGNATRAEHIAAFVADRYREHSAAAWVMNYPGYGGSAGPARLSAIASAALTAFDELKRHAGDKPIIVAGNSLGTAAALHVAANRPVAGLVLQNPPPLRQLILRRHGWWNLWLIAGPIALQVPRELSSVANAQRLHVPAVFITADADEIVPAKYHRMVIDAYAGPKRTIALGSASHNSAMDAAAERQVRDGIRWILQSDPP